MRLLKGAEKAGLKFTKRMGTNSLAELRKIAPDQWLNDPASQMGGFWPVIDGYVITGNQYKLYEASRYNDVDVIIGTNSDEGSLFVRPVEPAQYIENIHQRFGPLANQSLDIYPATDAPTAILFLPGKRIPD
jgi:para-nitrobenzyl esterase